MTSRARWHLVGVGLLLISLSSGSRSGAGASAGSPPLDHAEIRELLVARNPRLGGVHSERIATAVLRCRDQQQLRPALVLAVMRVESDMRPSARSPKGAIGLMQVMPGVFHSLDLPGAIAHMETNVEAGCLVLADNIRRRGERDGISSYFWGNRIRGPEYLQRVEAALDELAVEAEAVRSRS